MTLPPNPCHTNHELTTEHKVLVGYLRGSPKGLTRVELSHRLGLGDRTVRALIDDYCGGMQDGHIFAAYLPGGASGGILPARLGDIPLDFGKLEPHGAFIGSAAVIVLSDQDDVRTAALNLMRFFADESCGQCTPCRVGTEKAVTLMQNGPWDAPLLSDLAQVMRDASICGLGQAAPNVFETLMRYFPEVTQ